jgi:hypothetical protein
VSGWKTWSWLVLVALSGMAATACGSQSPSASEPKGKFPVAASSSFPSSQRLANPSQLVVKVTNTGHKTVPDVAVTITDGTPSHPDMGTQVQAFNYLLNMSNVASRSRPVWVVNQAPGPCQYSCKSGGPGAAATAFSNTWALGPLKPGKTAVFDWHLTAVHPGNWVVNWRVAAGLYGKAKAVTADGSPPRGSFTVHISQIPPRAYVNNNHKIVTTNTPQPYVNNSGKIVTTP